MNQHERETLAYALRRQQMKRRREAMMYGRVRRVLDLRTGEATRMVVLRFPARLDNVRDG